MTAKVISTIQKVNYVYTASPGTISQHMPVLLVVFQQPKGLNGLVTEAHLKHK